MSTSATTLKTYFETGDKPTATEFGELIDGNLNLNDGGTVAGATAFTLNITASAGLSASGDISSTETGSFVGGISCSGDLRFGSQTEGIKYDVTASAASADAATYTVHGRRFTIKNQLQAALAANSSSALVTVTNNQVADGDIILGQFTGNMIGNEVATSLMYSASIHCFTTSSAAGFKYYITNNYDAPILDNSGYTASFIVFK